MSSQQSTATTSFFSMANPALIITALLGVLIGKIFDKRKDNNGDEI